MEHFKLELRSAGLSSFVLNNKTSAFDYLFSHWHRINSDSQSVWLSSWYSATVHLAYQSLVSYK